MSRHPQTATTTTLPLRSKRTKRNRTRTYHHNWPGGHEQQIMMCTTTIFIIYHSLNVAVEMTVNVKYNGDQVALIVPHPRAATYSLASCAKHKVVTHTMPMHVLYSAQAGRMVLNTNCANQRFFATAVNRSFQSINQSINRLWTPCFQSRKDA